MQFLATLTILATAAVAVALPGFNMAQASCKAVRFPHKVESIHISLGDLPLMGVIGRGLLHQPHHRRRPRQHLLYSSRLR